MAPSDKFREEADGPKENADGLPGQAEKPRTQEEADLALARALQEQERAYFMLRQHAMGGEGGASEDEDYEGFEDEGGEDFSEEEEEDGEHAEDLLEGEHSGGEHELSASQFNDDEAFARALQEAEDREATARMMAMAGIHVQAPEEAYDSGSEGSQDMWREADPDNMTYEELLALGEVVGVESKGLPAAAIAALPDTKYKQGGRRMSSTGQEQCVICRVEFADGESVLSLPCRHHYHGPCIQQWLANNKTCPVCTVEVVVAPAERPPDMP